jgi:hypothetical protein
MRRLTLLILCALLLPACLTQGLWSWAGDTRPSTPQPISCGVDANGTTIILVGVAGEEDPSFCLRIPADWRERIEVPIGSSGATVHSPLYVSPEPVPASGLVPLTPAPEEWFLSHEAATGSVDVLTPHNGRFTIVATADLPTEAHWGRRITAVALTPPALLLDTVTILLASTFFLWLDISYPWPWRIDSHHSSDASDSSSPPSDPGTGLITPAHGPS